jgi:predicted nucleotide-binding protein (sugar kinase/HSP70/actin superfamily)
MDKRTTKCLDRIAEAFKELIASANSETEMVGLVTEVLYRFQPVYEKAVEEGYELFENKEKEGN